jgi:hypothetical protein
VNNLIDNNMDARHVAVYTSDFIGHQEAVLLMKRGLS